MAASVRDHQMFSGRGSARQDQDQGPPGFSNRGAEAPSPGTVPVDVNAPPVMDDGAEGEVLELEHMIGFTGKNLDTIIAHPRLSEVYVKSVGSAVVVGDLNDPHNQEFLRGHNMEVRHGAPAPAGFPPLLPRPLLLATPTCLRYRRVITVHACLPATITRSLYTCLA